MNKFQNVSFQNIDEFLDYLPEQELEIVEELRRLVYECIPNVKEKLSYNVPFFSRKKRICFIWPSSVPWGKVKKDGVLLGFSNGYLLPDPYNWLEHGNRKQVYERTFFSMSEIDPDMVRFYLFEALDLDN